MISVVIPLYNKAHTIQHTLSTVLNQTYSDFEIVIVDDGSTDNGVEVIENFTNDKRINIISKNNEGVSVARNIGVLHSRFEYIAFLDADDEFLPKYLEEVVLIIQTFPQVGMIACGGFFKDFKTGKVVPRVAKKYIDKTVMLNYFDAPDVFSHTSATVVNKSVFLSTGGFPPGIRAMEDFHMFYKMGFEGDFIYCGKLLSVYVGGIEGQITGADDEQRYEHIKDELYVYNNIYKLWVEREKKNRQFIVFLRYKLRHALLSCLKSNDYRSIQRYVDGFDNNLKLEFGRLFIKVLLNQKFNKYVRFYILITKIIWRVNKFPRVGELKKGQIYQKLIERYSLN